MKLTDEQIQKLSETFGQPISVVKSIAACYDNMQDIQKNLYYLDEDDNDIDEDDEDDVEELIPEEIQEKMEILKELAAKELGISPDELEAKAIKANPELYNHLCPFTEEQRKNISCKQCPLYMPNFVPSSIQFASDKNISVAEAIEYIKFDMYHHTDEMYEKLTGNHDTNN